MSNRIMFIGLYSDIMFANLNCSINAFILFGDGIKIILDPKTILRVV